MAPQTMLHPVVQTEIGLEAEEGGQVSTGPSSGADVVDVNAKSLRLMTCGSVDDGKSTLIGRLLWDTKSVSSDHAETLQVSPVLDAQGRPLPEFALLLDGLQAEREQGITIDVAYRYFSTPKRSFIVADTPGHQQYTRNMATGCSTTDLAIVLVDARTGLLEQTRRHTTIAATMGVSQFVLVVNKIDLVDYDERVFSSICQDFSEFALSLGITDVTSIPVSALRGFNVVFKGSEAMPWYDGPTLLETIERASTRTGQGVGFRLPVQRVSRPHEGFRGYQGTIAGGSVKPGDSVVILPSGEMANVSQIVTYDLVRNAGVAGDAVSLVLDRPIDIARGDMIASPEARPMSGRKFEAKIIALSAEGLVAKRRYWLKTSSRRQFVTMEIGKALDLQGNFWADADSLAVNTIGDVRLRFEEVALFDTYNVNRDTGSFILIDPESNNTVAAGMISGQPANQTTLSNPGAGELMVLTLPVELGEKLLHSPLLARHRNDLHIHRIPAAANDSGGGEPN